MRFALLALLLISVSGACVLPVGTAAPQPATTAGKGNMTVGFRAEVPTIDLLETAEDGDSDYDVTPFPVISPELGIGIHDKVDLEMSIDFTLFVVVPLPTGITGGARIQLLRTDALALALAGRAGVSGVSTDVDREGQEDDDEGSLSAFYGYAGLTMQANPFGRLRPGLAANYWRARIRENDDGDITTFSADMGVLTFSLDIAKGAAHFGPFFNAILIRAEDFAGTEASFTGGVFFYARFGELGQIPDVPR